MAGMIIPAPKKAPAPRDSGGDERANGSQTPCAMKESERGEDPAPSAVVSGASASPSIPDLASRNAAPALTSQPGEVAEDDRAEAARGTHGAAGPIALVNSDETIDPPISKISAPLPASVSATLTEHKPGVYAYGNDEMGYFYIAAEDVPVARAYVDNGGTGSARSSLTNSPMNPRAALGFSPFMPPTPHDSPGPIGHQYQPSPAGSVNGGAAAAHVNYAPSLAHGGSFLQYAAAAMATKGKQPASASTPSAPAPRSVDIPTPDAAAARAAREYESALQRWAAANNVPSDAALALPSTLMSPTQMSTQMYPYGMPGWHSPPSPNGYQPGPPSANRGSPIYPYHSNGGYGMVPIPPANVVSPPAYLNSGYVSGTDVRGDHYGLSGPTSHHPVTYNGGWAEEFPTLGARSARSSMNSAGSTNGGGPFISSKPSGKPPSSGGPRVSSAAADPNFRDALWRSAAAEAREVGDRLEIPPISAFDGADLADLFESSSDGVRFFVMKSHGEDDVHRSVRYGWWSSTQAGNARLDAAYRGVDEEEEETEPEAESLGDLPKTLDESCGMDDLNRAFIVNAGAPGTREDTRETTTDDLAPDSSDISRASDEDDDSQSPAGPLDVSAGDGLPLPRDPSKIDAVDLDDADRPTPRIILFFSVNCSGHFCGVAEMVGPVESLDLSAPRDAHLRSDVDGGYHWRRSTPGALAGSGRGTVPPNGFSLADGRFRVRWHWVKDVPNTVLRHIRLVTGNEKPVTNSRDGQEVEPSQGAMVLSVFREFRGGSSLLLDDKSRAFYSMAGGYHTSRTAGKARAGAMGGGGGGRKPPLHSYPGSMVMAANPYQNFRAAMPGGYGGGYGAFPYQPHHHPNAMNPYDGHGHIGGPVAAPFPLGAIASHAAASHGPRPPAPAPEFKFGENGPGGPPGIETNRT